MSDEPNERTHQIFVLCCILLPGSSDLPRKAAAVDFAALLRVRLSGVLVGGARILESLRRVRHGLERLDELLANGSRENWGQRGRRGAGEVVASMVRVG